MTFFIKELNHKINKILIEWSNFFFSKLQNFEKKNFLRWFRTEVWILRHFFFVLLYFWTLSKSTSPRPPPNNEQVRRLGRYRWAREQATFFQDWLRWEKERESEEWEKRERESEEWDVEKTREREQRVRYRKKDRERAKREKER